MQEQTLDVHDVLMQAVRDVEGVPGDLRQIAFDKAVDLRARVLMPHTLHEEVPLAAGDLGDARERRGGIDAGSPLEAIAERLGLPLEAARDVYNVAPDGSVELVVSPAKLPKQSASATKEIALMIAAGQQATGIDWTPFGDIRSVCNDYRKLDSANFASTLQEMRDEFVVRSASPRKKEVRVARPGWERAAALVRRMANSE